MTVEITFEEPPDSGQEQSIEFDAVVADSHEATATITEHAIEEGANVTDHIRADNDSVTLQAFVSNQPIRVPKTNLDGVAGSQQGLEIVDTVTGIVLAKANVLAFDGEFDRVRSVYEELLRLRTAGTIVRILTSLREYENMVIRRVNPTRDGITGDALSVVIEASEIRVVDSEVVDAPLPEETRGRTRRDLGRDNPDEADEATEERTASWASQIVTVLGRLAGPNEGSP